MKKTPFSGVCIQKTFDEFAADFIGVLADQRADGRDDAGAVGAEFLHRVDSGFQHTGQRALPAGVRCTDHARAGVGEQDRAAIRSGDTDSDAFGAGDERVGTWLVALPRSGRHHDVGRMDLVRAEQALGRNAHLCGHPAAIFRDTWPDRRWSRGRH